MCYLLYNISYANDVWVIYIHHRQFVASIGDHAVTSGRKHRCASGNLEMSARPGAERARSAQATAVDWGDLTFNTDMTN